MAPSSNTKPSKTTAKSSAEITEAEKSSPDAAWEATVTKGMKETEGEMILQWLSILMIGLAVFGYMYL